jgi:hypothetical protein
LYFCYWNLITLYFLIVWINSRCFFIKLTESVDGHYGYQLRICQRLMMTTFENIISMSVWATGKL